MPRLEPFRISLKKEKMRKPVKEHKSVTGLAFLVESELEKAQVVIAAQSILDKMQKMAEDLAKIEADDIMPMLDSMRLTFGPELTDSFNDITTAKIRQTMEAVKGAKEAITTEVGRLERNINGEMTNDMGMDTPDIGDDETDMDLGDKETDMDLGDEETDMDLEEPEEDKVDFDTAFDSAANSSAAGRARKESVERNIKALSESSNPDRLIYATFRRTLTETKDAVRSAHAVASAFAIDLQDVVSIVKESSKKDPDGRRKNNDHSEARKSKKRERPSDLDEALEPWMRKPTDTDFDTPSYQLKAEHEKREDEKKKNVKDSLGGGQAVKTAKNKEEMKAEAYDKTAVDKAISSSRQKIGGREAKKIHALLKGSTGYAAKKNAEETKKTFPNVKHLTKDGHPDWKKHGMGKEVELGEGKKGNKSPVASKDEKPDFLDLNKNGNTTEPMTKAAADMVEEKFDMKPTPESKKGMFKDKTQAELKSMLAATKKQMKSHEDKDEKVPHSLRTKFSQLTFALRAKHDWGKVESADPKKGFNTGGVAEGERDATATTRGSSIVDTLEGMIAAFSQRENTIEEAKSSAGAVKLVMAKKTKQKPFKVSNPKITK